MHNVSLNREIEFTFKWYKKLTKRFIDLAFWETLTVVAATLFSQIFMLLSSMMPLKVIMLLGSDRIPRYFPNSWQSMERDTLILYLALASVGFFLLYLLCEKIIVIYAQKGSEKILANNQKVVLFERQDLFAQTAYTKQSKSLANIIFFLLASIGLTLLYPPLGIVIGLFVLLTYFVFVQMYSDTKLHQKLSKELTAILNTVKGVGFIVVFTFILTSLLNDFYPPHIIIAIIAVLLIRQMFSQLNAAIKDIVYIYKNRLKINSLFFFGHTKLKLAHDKKDSFWALFDKTSHSSWLKDILNEVLEVKVELKDIQWYKLNIKNIAFLEVTVVQQEQEQKYFVKVFNKNITSQAIHEATLLEKYPDSNFSLKLLCSTIMNEYHINIYKHSLIALIPLDEFSAENLEVRIKVMQESIDKELKNRYIRSHQFLYKRISHKMIERLLIIAEKSEISLVQKFQKDFNSIIKRIQNLPLQIINPHISMNTIVREEKSTLLLLHWGNWKIDTLGSDYPITLTSIQKLQEKLKDKKIPINDIILSALMSQFEKLYNNENFTGIIKLLPKILEYTSNEQ